MPAPPENISRKPLDIAAVYVYIVRTVPRGWAESKSQPMFATVVMAAGPDPGPGGQRCSKEERHALRGDVSGGRRTEYEPALSQSGLFFVRFTLRLKRAPIEMPASHAQMDTRVLCTRRYV